MSNYFVYILASESKTIYIGVTNNLERRLYEHRSGTIKGFSSKYNCKKLVYFEYFNNINDAIIGEKKLKNWKRAWKVELIEKNNPYWEDIGILLNDDSETSSEGQLI